MKPLRHRKTMKRLRPREIIAVAAIMVLVVIQFGMSSLRLFKNGAVVDDTPGATITNLHETTDDRRTPLHTKMMIVFVILLLFSPVIIFTIPKNFLFSLPEYASWRLHLPEDITWQSLLAQFGASLMLHFQGLMTLQSVDGRAKIMLQAVVGAGLEGIFVLSLMVTLLQKNSQPLATGFVCLLGIVSTMFLCSMTTFMRKTGLPTLPDMFVVILGLKEARTSIKAEFSDDLWGTISRLVGAYACALPAAFLVWREGRRDKKKGLDSMMPPSTLTLTPPLLQRRRSIIYFFVLFMILVFDYCSGAWVPIFHVYASMCGSLIFSAPGSSSAHIALLEKSGASKEAAPNLMLFIHESMSGEFPLTKEENLELMPFLKKMIQSNDGEFFVFENPRTVSGDTAHAIPAIVSGCLPLNEDGIVASQSTNMATQAKMRGYQTLSFSSRLLNMKGTYWFAVENALSVNFDQIWHPDLTGDPLVNGPAQSDRLMGNHFKSWIDERSQSNETTKTPFFAQFYYFDSHYPFFKGDSNATSNAGKMLMNVDKGVEDIFRYLKDAGELDNTIVIATGDHGEYFTPGYYARLRSWDANVLHPLMYIYVPNKVSAQHPEIVTNLNYNRKQLVSTLDLFPTMLRILNNTFTKNEYYNSNGDDDCIRGYDLFQKIDSDRVAWSFPNTLNGKKGNFAVHYRGSSLVDHFGWPKGDWLKIITYDKVVGSPIEERDDDNILTFAEWKSFMKGMIEKGSHGMPRVAMNSSDYMTRLLRDLEQY